MLFIASFLKNFYFFFFVHFLRIIAQFQAKNKPCGSSRKACIMYLVCNARLIQTCLQYGASTQTDQDLGHVTGQEGDHTGCQGRG